MGRWKNAFVLPSLLFAAILTVHGWLFLSGIPVAEAAREGWLLSPLPSNLFSHTLQSLQFGQIIPSLDFRDMGNAAALLLITAIVILLNSASVEIATGREMNLDRELKMTGLSNVAAAPFGGMPGCIALSRTLMNWQAGADSRLSGFVSALTCGAILFAGAPLVSLLPRPVLGAPSVPRLVLVLEWVCRAGTVFPGSILPRSFHVVIIASRGSSPGWPSASGRPACFSPFITAGSPSSGTSFPAPPSGATWNGPPGSRTRFGKRGNPSTFSTSRGTSFSVPPTPFFST